MTTQTRDNYLDLITGELERVEAARTSLAGFVRYQLGKEPATHHRLICDAVDALLNDEFDDLLILMPPNSAKSFYTSIAIPPYYLGKYPEGQILAISGTAELAQSWGRQARNNIANPSIQTPFPRLALSDDSRAVDSFATVTGGTYRSFGVNSQILGQRASILLIDDPVTSAANSLPMLKTLHSYYENEALTRLNPKTGKVILVCQRLDRNDLAGYMIDRNAQNETRRLKVLKLKFICEEGDDDPLGRKPGEVLWPEYYGDINSPWVRDVVKNDPYRFRTLFQQEPPSDTGEYFRKDWLQFVDEAPRGLNHYLATDLALSVGTGDYSVHITAGIDDAGRIYIVDAWRAQSSINDTAEQQLTLIERYQPFECLIEDDNASKVYAVTLEDRGKARGVRPPWKVMPIAGKEKQIRAAPFQALMQQRKVFFVRAPWNRWLVHQLLIFPTSAATGMDDGVDALGLVGRRLLKLSKPAGPPVRPKPGPTVQQMTLNELFEDREHRGGSRGPRI